MSSETLSQSEIDLLLGAAPATRAAVSATRARPDLQVYDFRRPHRVSKERLRTLEAMYERLVKSLEGWLMGRVRGQVEMRLLSVEQFSFGEFILSLSTPCASYIFDIHDSGGQQAVVDFGLPFAYFLVDRLFGGGGGGVSVPDRPLTPIERMAVRVVGERVAAEMTAIWQDHVRLDLALNGFESIPEILRAANREDPVLVANIEVSAGGSESLVLLCLPFAVLEKFFVSGGQRRIDSVLGSEREREQTRELTATSVRATRLEVGVRLPEFRLSMRELAEVRVGDVLSTGIPVDSELQVRVNSQPRFRAAAGRVGRRLAVRVIETVGTGDDAPAPVAEPNP